MLTRVILNSCWEDDYCYFFNPLPFSGWWLHFCCHSQTYSMNWWTGFPRVELLLIRSLSLDLLMWVPMCTEEAWKTASSHSPSWWNLSMTSLQLCLPIAIIYWVKRNNVFVFFVVRKWSQRMPFYLCFRTTLRVRIENWRVASSYSSNDERQTIFITT